MKQEWERQEEAFRHSKLDVPARAQSDPYYLAIARELCRPLDCELEADFAPQVAARVTGPTARTTIAPGTSENALLCASIGTLGVALVWILAQQIGSGRFEALWARMPAIRNPWLGLALVYGFLPWAFSRARSGDRNERLSHFG